VAVMFLDIMEEYPSQVETYGIVPDGLVSTCVCLDAYGVQGDGVPFHQVIGVDTCPEAGKDVVLDEVAPYDTRGHSVPVCLVMEGDIHADPVADDDIVLEGAVHRVGVSAHGGPDADAAVLDEIAREITLGRLQ